MYNGQPPQYPQQPQPQPQPPQYSAQYQAPPRSKGRFSISPSTVIIVVVTLLFIVAGGFGVWAYLGYSEAKTDIDGKVATAVADAKKVQADDDAKKFAEKDKEPNRTFVGPDDYGRVTFDYPKTWSAFIESDVSNGGTYTAYFNPVQVPPVSNKPLLALNVTIQQTDTGSILQSYDSRVKKGTLKSSAITINGVQGTRLDGEFNKDTVGAMVVFKIRDKTLVISTDSQAFVPDFNNLIQTIKFNQ